MVENLIIDYRWFAGNPVLARAAAAELIDLSPDVILAGSSPGLSAVAQATRTIPTVFVAVSDPVGQRFVQSSLSPEGNITGFTLFEWSLAGKLVELLKEVVPSLEEVNSVLYHPQTSSASLFVRALAELEAKSKVELVELPVRSLRGNLSRLGWACGLRFRVYYIRLTPS